MGNHPATATRRAVLGAAIALPAPLPGMKATLPTSSPIQPATGPKTLNGTSNLVARLHRAAGFHVCDGLKIEDIEQAVSGQFYSGVTRPMDRRYWCIILAAVGWLTLGNIERPPHKAAASEGVKSVKYHPDCASPSDASDAAVCASLQQVRVAEQANAIAANNLLWNEIGITAVVFTLAATAWAAVASSRAYAGFKGSERAHVFIEATTAINFLSDGSNAAVRVRIANRGSTPCWITGLHFAPAGHLPKRPAPIIYEHSFQPLIPDTPLTLERPFSFDPDDFQSFLRGEKRIWVVGGIRYRDIFGGHHQTRFGYEITANGPLDPIEPIDDLAYWRYT